MKSTRMAAAVAAVTVTSLVAVVGSSISSAATEKTITISVASLIPGSTPEAITQFNNQVKEFQKANPKIHVNSVEYQWTGPTFAAKLAAGTLPTVFTVPFTDARTLGENGQIADLTKEVKALPYFSKFNPAVLAEGTTSKKKIVALPTAAYAQALHYNRKLFSQAGLDPNKPPTTWGQLRADAKQISAKTGKAGYVQMAKDDNTAGWILTTLVYALGGRMEIGTGTSARATLNNSKTVTALNMLKAMRWTDNSMGSNFDYGWSDINQNFAAGNIGMYISGSDVYTNLVSASNIDPSVYGEATIPLAKNKTAGVLGGGTLAAVRPDANAAARAAAIKWIDFFYEKPLISKAQAIRNAQTLVASKQPVGVPALPIFNKAQYDLANTWIKPYINVSQAQVKPFTKGIFAQRLIPEPPASTQSVYHSLDAAVEAVLTDKNANVTSMLADANSAAQSAISQGK
ncbi:MAG: multiple sugar transport system substrate-binding protein [Gaiellaceae bacterium]|jgi:multiple sugar transport system substrate-binding protein|nr:multiple sugar transport system substrate-binding protein [Gaiellaceae bacterium]